MKRHSEFTKHTGITSVLAPLNPFTIPPNLPAYGVLLGRREDHSPFFLNLVEWETKGIINTPNVFVMGMQDMGKTTLLKLIARDYGSRRTRPKDPTAPFRKIWIDDSKKKEYDPLAQYFNCPSLELGDKPINPLSSDMELADQSFICRLILKSSDGYPISVREHNALDAGLVALNLRLRPGEEPSLQGLVSILNSDTVQPPPIYPGATEFIRENGDSFREDCLQLTLRMSNMLRGSYGTIFGFGTDQTITDMLAKRVVNVDYSGIVNEEVVRIIQTLFWIRKKRNMPDANFFDESYSMLRHQEHVQPLHDAMKTNRAQHKPVFISTHALRDLGTLSGDAGKLARSLFNEAPVRITGKLEENDVIELQDTLRFNDRVANMIRGLEKYEFMAFIGNTEPFMFTSIVPERMLAITFSNQAREAELGRKTH